MKDPYCKLDLNSSYEDVERQLARHLGLSGTFAQLRQAQASAAAKPRVIYGKAPAPALSEKEAIEQMFAGKNSAERLALVRANKARIQEYLRNSHQAPAGKSSAYVTRSINGGKTTHRILK